ncbi:mucin-13 [Erethizon dorsatum]
MGCRQEAGKPAEVVAREQQHLRYPLSILCVPGTSHATWYLSHCLCQEHGPPMFRCPFGYSGMDCKDQFQLILTIVGTILGVFIIGLVIALVISMRSRNRKKNIEEQNLIENDFQNLRLQQTGFSNPGAEGSLFPKVKTEASRDLQVSNPYAGQ